MTHSQESDKLFIQTWWQSSSIQEVADKLGWTRKQVHSRATCLRAKGVVLKPIRKNPHRPKSDWQELCQLAKKLEDAAKADKYRKSS